MGNIKIFQKHRSIARILLNHIFYYRKNGRNSWDKLIEYSQVYEQLGASPYDIRMKQFRREHEGYMGDLSAICVQLDLPMISAIVITKKKPRIPGPGFFNLYRDLYPDCAHWDNKTIWDDEVSKVIDTEGKWHLLSNYLEIPTEFGLQYNATVKNQRNKEMNQLYAEGKEQFSIHKSKERNPKLILAAKEQFSALHGDLYCETCKETFHNIPAAFRFSFFQGHHRKPLKTVTEEHLISINEIMIVCPNCHVLMHIEELSDLSQYKYPVELHDDELFM